MVIMPVHVKLIMPQYCSHAFSLFSTDAFIELCIVWIVSLDDPILYGIIIFTYQEVPMPKQSSADRKREALRSQGTLHLSPERVTDELFRQDDFFDPRDSIQVKYEMLRRVRVDRQPIRRVAQAFGFSRPSLYQAVAHSEQSRERRAPSPSGLRVAS